MTTVRIPDWNSQGVLPPNDPIDPTAAERSPYAVSLTDFVLHFGTTEKRQTILEGLLGFRAILHAAGLGNGFQWVDGSFLEEIEKIENHAPADFGSRRRDSQRRAPESRCGRKHPMNLQERRQLLAEKTSLERMLASLPESSVIDRMSLEARKAEVEEVLAAAPTPARQPVHARLTFRGKPIVGSHGMFAEFGAKAISAFTDAVAAIGASQITALGTRGALPNREEYQLLITGTAVGSFGFELEEAPSGETLFPEMSSVDHAIEQTLRIMEASIGTDDELTEAIADADPRAVEALRAFLQTLADQEAICALEFKEEVFRFADVGQVRRSEGRLRQDNIHEEDKRLSGQFLGVLPHRRTFEFKVSESDEIITGKVGKDIDDAAAINHVLERSLTIQVHAKRAGSGRPKYTLLSYEQPETSEN